MYNSILNREKPKLVKCVDCNTKFEYSIFNVFVEKSSNKPTKYVNICDDCINYRNEQIWLCEGKGLDALNFKYYTND